MDPKRELIHHRLYREHCHISNEGYFVKDLRILGRKMKDILLVDNAAYSYAFQLDNGIPIIPYYEGKSDFELKALQHYLEGMLVAKDLREVNKKTFKLHEYTSYDDV